MIGSQRVPSFPIVSSLLLCLFPHYRAFFYLPPPGFSFPFGFFLHAVRYYHGSAFFFYPSIISPTACRLPLLSDRVARYDEVRPNTYFSTTNPFLTSSSLFLAPLLLLQTRSQCSAPIHYDPSSFSPLDLIICLPLEYLSMYEDFRWLCIFLFFLAISPVPRLIALFSRFPWVLSPSLEFLTGQQDLIRCKFSIDIFDKLRFTLFLPVLPLSRPSSRASSSSPFSFFQNFVDRTLCICYAGAPNCFWRFASPIVLFFFSLSPSADREWIAKHHIARATVSSPLSPNFFSFSLTPSLSFFC